VKIAVTLIDRRVVCNTEAVRKGSRKLPVWYREVADHSMLEPRG